MSLPFKHDLIEYDLEMARNLRIIFPDVRALKGVSKMDEID